jgi:hypothetical protein
MTLSLLQAAIMLAAALDSARAADVLHGLRIARVFLELPDPDGTLSGIVDYWRL